jgi:acetyl esterase/lipase
MLLALLTLTGPAKASVSGTTADVAMETHSMSEPMRPHRGGHEFEEDDAAGEIVLPAGAKANRDVAYGTDPAQRLDVYMPEHAQAAPIIFMVHGGAWMLGDKAAARVVANKAARWLPKGFIFISANYRLVPSTDVLGQADDVAKALAFAQANAKLWGGDPSRLILMGHSAGAHLAALLAADPAIASRQGAKPWLGTVMLDSAAFDVVQIMKAEHRRFYDRVFGNDPAYWRQTSPLHRLSGVPKPMLLVCSSRRSDSCPHARSFADKVTSMGGRATVQSVSFTHREINENLGVAGTYTDTVEAFFRSLGLN